MDSLLRACWVDAMLGLKRLLLIFRRPWILRLRWAVKIIFVSVHAGDTDRNAVYNRLRAIGENAEPAGIKVCLETHPDMAHNGEIALETMEAVNHPNICVNFDTGNVYYYNHNVTAVSEVQKVLPHVGAVHLKDTNGGYRTWHFPTLGEGVGRFQSGI